MPLWLYPVIELNVPRPIQDAVHNDCQIKVALNGRFLKNNEYALTLTRLALGVPAALKTSDYLTVLIEELDVCWEHFRGEWKDVSRSLSSLKPLDLLSQKCDDDSHHNYRLGNTHLTPK